MRILTGVEKSNTEHWHLMPEFQIIGDTTKDYYLLSNIEQVENMHNYTVLLYKKNPSKLIRLHKLESFTDLTHNIDYENNFITYGGVDWDSNYMYGLLDTSGNEVLPFCFSEIRIVGPFILAQYHEYADDVEAYKKDKGFIFNWAGNEICEAIEAEHLYQDYYLVSRGGNHAQSAIIYAPEGKFLTPFYDEILFDTPGFICTKTAGKYQLRMMNDLENTIAEEPDPISNPIYLQNQLRGYVTGSFGREKLICP